MKIILPQYGIDFEVIKRVESDNEPISASRVRRLLKEKNFDEIREIVPKSTYEYLINQFGDKIIQ
jgi:[citrate (pro-3S)-lyase] ligase